MLLYTKKMAVVVLAAGIIFTGTQSGAVKVYFEDPQYSFQLLRALSATAGGGADIGECLKTAYQIKEGDDNSWYEEWYKTGGQLEKIADQFLADGDKQSASQAYLRASNYYRTADFFLRSNSKDARIIDCWSKSRDAFLDSVKLIDKPIIKPVKIPFEETTLPGYYCLADNSGKKRPLLIIQTGFDGTKEELYYQIAVFALKRDYNCLLFEGPGQGEVIRVQKIPFRYNWETVVAPVIDFALKKSETIPSRIALMGISFGGYLAPRAVAFEHRIKICVANGGVYDFHQNFSKGKPSGSDDPKAEKEINNEIYEEMEKNPGVRWVFGNGMWTFGAESPSELIKMARPYTMKNVADKIKCKMLIVDSEGDSDMPGQAKKLYEALKCPKEYMLFTKEEGAEEHCQMGACFISTERIFNWLDKNL